MLHLQTIYVITDPWGSIAEWVAGIGTVGTLIVTLAIVLGDRRKQTRSEADSFTTWSELSQSRSGRSREEMTTKWYVNTTFYNAGGRPIPYAALSWWDGDRWNRSMATVNMTSSYVFATGDSGSAQSPMNPRKPLDWNEFFITFRDGSNRTWYRTPFDNAYISPRKVKRLFKHGPKPIKKVKQR